MTLAFFMVVGALFPLGLGPTPALLARVAGGVLWVTALLAAMLSFDRLFQQDADDGGLDLLALSGLPLAVVRSEERRVGKEWVRTCRSRWSPDHEKKKNTAQTPIINTNK